MASDSKTDFCYLQLRLPKHLKKQLKDKANYCGVSVHHIAKRAFETYLLMNSTANIRR